MTDILKTGAYADTADRLLAAARGLLPDLEAGRGVNAASLRAAMEQALGGTDAEGAWDWKSAYDAGEAAQILFLRKYGPSLFRRSAEPHERLRLIEKIAALLPTHTRRSETSQALQQFSTPAGLAYIVALAGGIGLDELVLEPSAEPECSRSRRSLPARASTSTSLRRSAPLSSRLCFRNSS